MHSQGKKRLNGEPVPAHLLLLDHSSCDDFIDCGLDPSCGNRLIGPVALAVIRQMNLSSCSNISPSRGARCSNALTLVPREFESV